MAVAPALTASSAADRAAAIAAMCKKPHRTENGGWSACCPAHDDHDPSLTIDVGREGNCVVLHCHKAEGCSPDAICAALGLQTKDLFCQDARSTQEPEAVYDYVDEHGTLLFQACRWRSGKSRFTQRSPHPTIPGAWVTNIQGVRRVLYRLPEVLHALAEGKPIYIAEGEKDVDALWALGLPATCNPMGAGKWKEDSYDQPLAGATCYLLPDHDATGARHVNLVAKRLALVDATVKIVPGIHTEAEKSDVFDWLQAGGTREQLVAAAAAAPVWTPGSGPVIFGAQLAQTNGWMGKGNAANDASPRRADPATTADWWTQQVSPFQKGKRDLYEANDTTLLAILRNHPDWAGRLWWDDFASKIMLDDKELEEHRITAIGGDFGLKYKIPITSDRQLEKCLLTVAKEHGRDPLKHYLNSLPGWDGEPRLESWLLDYAGLKDTDYNRFCSRILPVSMIARGYDPGCICRATLILQGPQDYGKSTFVSALVPFPDWGDVISANLDSKEAHMMVQGLWVAELDELASLNRTEESRLKSFITLRVDAHIPKFRSMRVRPLRRTIFVGTTNKSAFLRDTENTRFLPVKINQPLESAYFLSIRDQVFAEAKVFYYDNIKTWWRMSSEATAQAVQAREERRLAEPIEDDLAAWLATHADTTIQRGCAETSWQEIATGFWKFDTMLLLGDQRYQRQTAAALIALGWEPRVRERLRPDGTKANKRVWQKEFPTPF